jgi:nucleotide-binding universal stress UspA family protein
VTYQRVLVPIDFSDDALSAFQVALDHFAGPERSLVLLHVVDPADSELQQAPEIRAGLVEERRRRMTTLGNSRKGAWKEVVALVESGKPADVIIATAKNENADLVIMGSHGSGSLGKLLFGSTTYDVARKVKCSVMISKRAVP